MIDHLQILVSDYEKSKAFYLAALSPLGYEVIREMTQEEVPQLPFPKMLGMGVGGKPDLWIHEAKDITPMHVAFRAGDHAAVNGFHKAALAHGGKDNGAAGPRAHYHPHYYGAFVHDPDGHNVEAVCHAPQTK